jgi:hypothetical protein
METAKPVMEVTKVTVARQKSSPVKYLITAHGVTSTSGWAKPRLLPRTYVRFPDDGIQDLDFAATPPSGLSNEVLTRVTSEALQMQEHGALRGFRIHAARNSIEHTWASTATRIQAANLDDAADVPSEFHEDRAPTVLTGVVQPAGIGFCMDGATHLLHHGMGATRLKARTAQAYSALVDNEDGANRVILAGYPTWGPECMYLSVYQVLLAESIYRVLDDRFVPFPFRVVAENP